MGKRTHSTSDLLDAAHGSSRAATDGTSSVGFTKYLSFVSVICWFYKIFIFCFCDYQLAMAFDYLGVQYAFVRQLV